MTDEAAKYCITYQAAKAAMRAYAAQGGDQLFELAREAFQEFEIAKASFLVALDPKNNKPGVSPQTPTATRGVSQTHCIK